MAQYSIDTDRGTLTITGTFSGKMRQNLISIAAPVEGCASDTASLAICTSTITTPYGGSVTVEEYISGVSGGGGTYIGAVDYGIRLTAVSGFGDTDTVTVYETINPKASGVPTGDYGTDVTASYSGTFEFVFQLESLIEVTGSGFPSYGGSSVVDTPPLTDVGAYERFVPGSTVSAEISAEVDFTVYRDNVSGNFTSSGSGTASASDTVSSHELMPGYGFSLYSEVLSCENDTVTATCALNSWLGATRPTIACTSTAGSATATATASGLSATVTVTASGTCLSGYGTASNTVVPKRTARLTGVVRRLEENYTGWQVEVWDGSGYVAPSGRSGSVETWVHTIEQEQYSSSVSTHAGDGSDPFNTLSDDDSNSDSVDEWNGIYARVKPTWLASEGLEAGLWRYLWRAFPAYDVFTLSQASERSVLTTYSGAGASDISRTISLANGADADLDGSAWSGFSLHGYAYLKIRLKKTGADRAISLKIGGKTWTTDRNGLPLTVTTAYQEYTIDLLNPSNATLDADAKNSRFPYASSGPIVVDDTEMWGVSNATAIVLSGLDAETYDVDYVKLVRDSYSRITVLNGYDNFVASVVGDPEQYQVRLLRGDTDGVVSKEVIALTYNTITGTYTHRTLEQVADDINGGDPADQPADGYTASKSSFSSTGCTPTGTDLAPISDCYLNLDRYAAWLEGAGAKYAGGAWDYCFRESVATSKSMQAQMLVDRLFYWPPGLDPFELEGSTRAFLPFATILKSRAIGVVSDETGKRTPTVEVTIDAGASGEAATASDGTYYTGTPYVLGGTTETVEASVGDTPPSASVDFKTRVEHRVSFRVIQQGGAGTFLLEDWHGQLHLSVVIDGDVYYYRANVSTPSPWIVNSVQVTDTGSVDGRAVMALDWRERLTLLFSDGTDTFRVVSDDDGATWSSAEVGIANGTKPFVVSDEAGNTLEAAVVGTGISGQFRTPGDTAFSSLFEFKDDTDTALVVDTTDCFCIAAAKDAPGRYLLSVVIDGESASSLWYSTDDARTWKRIT